MVPMTTLCTALLALTGGLVTTPALAADGDQGPTTQAVQNRQRVMRHEYSVWTGLLPMDAFRKGVAFSGAYTLHFTDVFAWEVAQFTYSVGIDTRLQDELDNLLGIAPTPFETVEWYGTTNFVFKPVYGKLAFLNRALIYHETYFVLGGGVGALTISNRPAIDIGVGTRIYGGKHFSVRLDARDLLFITSDDIQNEVWIGLGLSLSFGGGG